MSEETPWESHRREQRELDSVSIDPPVHFDCRCSGNDMPETLKKRYHIRSFKESWFVYDELDEIYAPSKGYFVTCQTMVDALNAGQPIPYPTFTLKWVSHPEQA